MKFCLQLTVFFLCGINFLCAYESSYFDKRVKLVFEDQTTIKWLSEQYKKSPSFYKLKRIQFDREFYTDLVKEHLIGLKKKILLSCPWQQSKCYRGVKYLTGILAIFLSLSALVEYRYKKDITSEGDRNLLHVLLSIPIGINSIFLGLFLKNLCTYTKRLNERIQRDQEMLRYLQQG
ncbi:MAG: hypothetical protein ACOYT8_06775 [Candidatus Dependentiae bacterium]